MSCATCIRWRRTVPHPRFRRKRPGYGDCRARAVGKTPFWVAFGFQFVLTHETHGAGCGAFKEKKHGR